MQKPSKQPTALAAAFATAALICTLTAGPAAADHSAAGTDFDRLKELSGTWTGQSPKGKRITQTLEPVSNETALLERFLDEGNPKFSNMVTLYYLDGDKLALTHYCSVPNQPHMVARPYDEKKKELVFECAGGGNMKSHDEGHMHHVVFRFETPDRITTEWTFQSKGKDVFTEVNTLHRDAARASAAPASR